MVAAAHARERSTWSDAATGSERLAAQDAELVKLGRGGAQLRLQIGRLLDELDRRAGHHELGFSSFSAYALERCERGRRWAAETKALARRIRRKGLTRLEREVFAGRLGWCAAELIARHATAVTEASIIEKARGLTVRRLQSFLVGPNDDAPDPEPAEPSVRKTKTAGRDEALLVESAKLLVEYINGASSSDEDFVVALLGEAESTLLGLGANRSAPIVPPDLDGASVERCREAMRALREAREAAAEPVIPLGAELCVRPAMLPTSVPTDLVELDSELRRLCSRLAARDLEMGHLARAVFRARYWRTLGYASPSQYAKERIGVSLSSLQHRITLAARLAAAPALGRALSEGRIGYEAAYLLSRAVTPQTADAWVRRAENRTIVHLKEELTAVDVMGRLEGVPRRPPDEAVLARFRTFEERVQSGELYESLLGSAAAGAGSQISVTLDAGSGQVVTFRISEDLYRHWRFVEHLYDRVARRGTSFVAFACLALWQSWMPHLEHAEGKWRHIHLRDRHRCTSPVCERHDVTLHHLKFRSRGGTDDPENLVSLCAWCHIHGIHEGRLEAEPPASNIRWSFGRTPILEVHGRNRLRHSST